MLPTNQIKKEEDYLDLFKIHENKYIIGVYQKGITFYKQQVRALNIFYGLVETGILKMPKTNQPRKTVGIIGGGVGGTTFAAACIKSGFKVVLIEEKSILLHMQHGCTTRKIHPYIYDWPEKDFDMHSPYAKIPILSWKAETADIVAEQVRKEFESIQNSANEKKSGTAIILKDTRLIRFQDKKAQVILQTHTKKTYKVDLLVFAIGYGIEKGISSKINRHVENAVSYWRNDDYSQPLVTIGKKKFCIWGTGDGALMDLARLCIKDFDLDVFFEFMKNEKKQYKALTDELTLIKDEWKKIYRKKIIDKSWLYKQFKKIPKTKYQYILKYLKTRWELNKAVYLVGNQNTFEETLHLNYVGFFNAFLAFVIKKYGPKQAVKYIETNEAIKKYKQLRIDKSIVRYGPDKETLLKSVYSKYHNESGIRKKQEFKKQLDDIRKKQEDRFLYDEMAPRWEYHELAKKFETSTRIKGFYRAETVGICTNFVFSLSKVLEGLSKNIKNFRITVHRVIKQNEEFCYQQMTSYYQKSSQAPSKRMKIDDSNVGCIYPIKLGNVGYSIRTGKSLVLKSWHKLDKEYESLISDLNLDKKLLMDSQWNSFLSIPILAKNKNGSLSTNLVVYIDSIDRNFFASENIINGIYNGLIGLLDSIESMLKLNQMGMAEANFIPFEINPSSYKLTGKSMKFVIDLSKKYAFLHPQKSALNFSKFYSFDVIYR